MEARSPPAAAPRTRQPWLTSAALLIGALAAAAGLHALALRSRVIGPARAPSDRPELVVVPRNSAVLETWRARGLRGRVVVHVGRFLHFISAEESDVPGPAGSGRMGAAGARYGSRSYLLAAAAAGVARRILYLSPPAAIDARLGELGLDRRALPLSLPARGFPRVLDDKLPEVDEPVLLDVNASFFDEGTAAGLLDALRKTRLRTDLVTLSLAGDADDVSDRAREQLQELAAALAGPARAERP